AAHRGQKNEHGRKYPERYQVHFQQSTGAGCPVAGYVCGALWGRGGPAALLRRKHLARRPRRLRLPARRARRGLGSDGRFPYLFAPQKRCGPQDAVGRGGLRSGHRGLRAIH
nr:hypothetical protein [Tanacetum cinerariifolium]